MKLWGVISEVNQKDLVISLPGGLRGLVRAADALDPALDVNIEVGIKTYAIHISFNFYMLDFCYVLLPCSLSVFPPSTRKRRMFSQACSVLDSWFLLLYHKWMMTIRRKGNGRYGSLCISLCCIKVFLWKPFKKEW